MEPGDSSLQCHLLVSFLIILLNTSASEEKLSFGGEFYCPPKQSPTLNARKPLD